MYCMLQLRKHHVDRPIKVEFLTILGIVKVIFLCFTTPLLEHIVEESNRYAAES